METKTECRYCHADIILSDSFISSTGRRKPLDAKTRHLHRCMEFARSTIAGYRKELDNIPAQANVERLCLSAVQYIQEINKRLENQGCYLKLERIGGNRP